MNLALAPNGEELVFGLSRPPWIPQLLKMEAACWYNGGQQRCRGRPLPTAALLQAVALQWPWPVKSPRVRGGGAVSVSGLLCPPLAVTAALALAPTAALLSILQRGSKKPR